MSTRSTIAFHDPETGNVTQIYCHFDGYLEGVGRMLVEHYSDPEKIAALIMMGDMSELKTDISNSVFYHRDRNEPWGRVKPNLYLSLDEYTVELNSTSQEFDYVFTNGEWQLCGVSTLNPYEPRRVTFTPVRSFICADPKLTV